jgi:hypothetical protein
MPYKPGQSGNPNGRPVGSGHKQKLFNEHVMPIKKELIQKVIEMALGGSEPMLKLLVERIIPKPTDTPVSFHLDKNKLDEYSLLDASENIIRSVADSEMMPDEAKSVTELIKGHRDALVLQSLSNKMSELQAKFEKINK